MESIESIKIRQKKEYTRMCDRVSGSKLESALKTEFRGKFEKAVKNYKTCDKKFEEIEKELEEAKTLEKAKNLEDLKKALEKAHNETRAEILLDINRITDIKLKDELKVALDKAFNEKNEGDMKKVIEDHTKDIHKHCILMIHKPKTGHKTISCPGCIDAAIDHFRNCSKHTTTERRKNINGKGLTYEFVRDETSHLTRFDCISGSENDDKDRDDSLFWTFEFTDRHGREIYFKFSIGPLPDELVTIWSYHV